MPRFFFCFVFFFCGVLIWLIIFWGSRDFLCETSVYEQYMTVPSTVMCLNCWMSYKQCRRSAVYGLSTLFPQAYLFKHFPGFQESASVILTNQWLDYKDVYLNIKCLMPKVTK